MVISTLGFLLSKVLIGVEIRPSALFLLVALGFVVTVRLFFPEVLPPLPHLRMPLAGALLGSFLIAGESAFDCEHCQM